MSSSGSKFYKVVPLKTASDIGKAYRVSIVRSETVNSIATDELSYKRKRAWSVESATPYMVILVPPFESVLR